ncbi:Mg2+ transporter MgtE [Thermanaerovibrio velox DSM 12556]|uniref:Magnesium transporter MgtE n=1 Tax=Thermanaerovibrio velox DSM 12556 TaxID=926567 RepID=H0UNW7_9BACT|nr:magnesium transporter [Thermanaerovibrio velox]EHM09453.1 Mg2+ transporter MgtE [Thermanaerovibrio velox DSM 12556]
MGRAEAKTLERIDDIASFLDRNPNQFLTVIREAHPAAVAEYLSELPFEEALGILRGLDVSRMGEIFSHLDEDMQLRVFQSFSREERVNLLLEMSPDDRADLFKALPEESQTALLPALAQVEREDIRRLASYEEGTAGAVMTSDYATISPEMTAQEAIEHLREIAPDSETIYYTYVVDDQHRLQGFVSLRELILAPKDAKVKDFMKKDPIFVRVDDDQEEAARKIQKYDLIALPVLNDDDVMVGIITHDDALDIITQEQTEDIEKLMAIGGAHGEMPYLKTPAWVHFKNRAAWIVALAALGFVSGMIIHSFESTLMSLMILALYMPMVADTGGNTGSQAATVVVRALALGEITYEDFFKVLFKEFKISLMLALVLGIISWIKVMYLSQGSTIPAGFSLFNIAVAIALALAIQVVSATLVGAVLPMLVHRLGQDPAVVASPALTTIVDITGLIIYFSTAKIILGL